MREEQFARRTIAVYFVCSSIWIVLYDGTIQHERYIMDMLPGIFFITVSSVVFYVVLRRKLRDLGDYDSMTNLPNMRYFTDRMNASLVKDSFRAVIILQLNQIQLTNSYYERTQKIELVKAFANRIKRRLESTDVLAVNAEHTFQVLLVSKTNKRQVRQWLDALLPELKEPFVMRGEETYPQMHIGIAFYPDDATDGEQLIKLGYYAAEEAKRELKDASICDKAMKSKIMESFHLESELRKAIASEQFELHYQPKLNVKTDKVTGAEALIRWNHPEKGMIRPDAFIPFAEQYGLIVPIGEWVIRRALADLEEWRRSGLEVVPISVNLSVRQFWHKDIVKMLAGIMEETGTDASLITLEITESLAMNPAQAIGVMENIKGLGVAISMDDFGTGYSSLANLRRFPIDYLKIDRSFVGNMEDDPRNIEIVGSMIRIAHTLGLQVVAEGVETAAQYRLLQEMECDEAQGYLLGRPMPTARWRQLLERAG